MCSTYVDAIKQRAAAGPIHLMGWSMGGFIAHDIACRLVAEGRQVPYLIIVDSDDTGEQQHVAQDFEAWADATLRALGDDNSSRPIADRLRALGEANRLPKYVPQTAADLADLERRFHLMHYFPGLLAERAPSGFYPGSTSSSGRPTRERVSAIRRWAGDGPAVPSRHSTCRSTTTDSSMRARRA